MEILEYPRLANFPSLVVLLCITAVPITPVLAFMKRWVFGLVLCKIVPSCQAISVLISSWCLCYIAIDRYRSIVTPLKEPWKLQHAQRVLMGTWLVAVFASSPLYFSQSLKTLTMANITLCGESSLKFCGEFNWAQEDHTKLLYGISLLVVQFVIPAVIMSLCYWKILQKVRADWIVEEGSMLTAAQQAQTAVRKRRVMYVLILMVVVFMTSWLPLSAVNLIKDLEIPLILEQMYFKLLNVHAIAMTSVVWNPLLYFWMSKILEQMYFKLLNVHAIAMTSVVWNPLLYFWMSKFQLIRHSICHFKRHRRALKNDMTWLTNARRQTNVGVLSRFAPSPSMSLVYRRTLERHLGASNFRCSYYFIINTF
ncbi:7 transmembrane receptor [Dictyocaulus viviparus]|uniref:7 transmembrane receptor n=1 Tax=Dictyocaulus viviparus TaxID=29172 RepID=A0A0D8XXH6_DICVI|nr:7 transmembrane receptor [Dictyocaulus viviparus]